jgi:hypothetical protein
VSDPPGKPAREREVMLDTALLYEKIYSDGYCHDLAMSGK